MLIRFIRHVRSQPKMVRNQYALIISVGFTGLVAIIWIFTSASVRAPGSFVAESQGGNIPFASLVNQTKAQLASVKAALQASVGGGSVSEESDLGLNGETVNADPRDLILTEETVAEVATTTTWQEEPSNTREYQEVQIVTTTTKSVATTTEDR